MVHSKTWVCLLKDEKESCVILRWSYSQYSVAFTNQAAFFIGGHDGFIPIAIIAKYENDAWSHYGNLKRRRSSLGSITSGTTTIVIGGTTDDGS